MAAIDWFNSSTILAVVAGLALALSVLLWLKIRRVSKVFNAELKRHKKELQLITQTHMGMGRKFLEIEKQVKQLSFAQTITERVLSEQGSNSSEATDQAAKTSANQQQPARLDSQNNANDNNHGTYNNAVNLFKQGLSADEVAMRCGLSKAEANLMALVNKELSPN